jgi:hypothetical protein
MTKKYNIEMDDTDFYAIKNRATLESQISSDTVTLKDIIIRALKKEIKSFKLLTMKKKGE